MRRIVTDHPSHVLEVADVPVDALADLQAWLAAQAKQHQLLWLLAHADDGVIWGRWTQIGGLVTSYEAAQGHPVAEAVCRPLRRETLQQARLFSVHAELLLWRDGDGQFQVRILTDTVAAETIQHEADKLVWRESFDETQRLLGTHAAPLGHDFSLLEDGAQGLRHAPPLSPLPAEIDPQYPPCLLVRHYLADEPLARIAVSRLVGLQWGGAVIATT